MRLLLIAAFFSISVQASAEAHNEAVLCSGPVSEVSESEPVIFRRLLVNLLPGGGPIYAYLTLAELEFRAYARGHASVKVDRIATRPAGPGGCENLIIIHRPKVRMAHDPPIVFNSVIWNALAPRARAQTLLRFLLGELVGRFSQPNDDAIDTLMSAINTGRLSLMSEAEADQFFIDCGLPLSAVRALSRPY